MAITDYRNFDLLITRSGERYRAFVVDAPGGDASAIFDVPFTPEELVWLDGLAGIRRGIEDDKRRAIGGGESLPKAANLSDLGQRLFQAIFQEDVARVLADSLARVEAEKIGLRLRLRFEQDAADLAVLPWEILYDPTHQHFLALGEDSPVLRYLSLPRSRSALLVKPPLRVLAVLASPSDLPTLDMDREWQAVQQALAKLKDAGTFVLERLERPSMAALQERLLGDPVHILHFVGHGDFDAGVETGSLVLEDGQGKADLVTGEQLATVLRNHTHLRLVYLNACEGALASGQSVFTGVAQILVKEGVPAAVAMQAEITDTGAIELARTFYTALAAGRPVDAALSQARVALARSDSQEWAIPVLFSRSPDNHLFDIREALPTPECPYPGMTPFTEAQQDLFFGREKEIADAVDRLRQHPFLAVIGPSGSGKSSLVYAGIIPALRKSRRFGPEAWTVLTMRPGQHPRTLLVELLPEPVQGRTLLFIDQFEEIFTQVNDQEAQGFLDDLKSLMGRPNLFILLTVRADFYPDLMASTLWQPIQANRLELPPLGDDELWAAIVEPAAQVGVTVDEALAVQLIADAAGQSGVLPLVQETLLLLWEKVERRELKLAAYRQMAEDGRSGLQVAINRRADIVYNNLAEEAKPMARRIFLRLIQFGEGRADTRRQQTVADLRARGDDPDLFAATLATLTDSRLLTTSGEEGSLTRQVDIAHEALIDGWVRLQEWLERWKDGEIARRSLIGKYAEWDRLGQSQGGLLDAYELDEATAWLNSPQAEVVGSQAELSRFVAISRQNIDASQLKARSAARLRRRVYWIGGILSGLLLVTLILVGGNQLNKWRMNRFWNSESEMPVGEVSAIAGSKEWLAIGSFNWGGALRTPDGNWSNWLATGLPTGNQSTESTDPAANVRDIRAITLDSALPQRPLAYIPSAGIYRLDSDGATWDQVGGPLSIVSEGTLPLAVQNGLVLFIPDEPGLFATRIQDDGNSTTAWQNLAELAPVLRTKINVVLFDMEGRPLLGSEDGILRGTGAFPYVWEPLLGGLKVTRMAQGHGGELFVVAIETDAPVMFCVDSDGETIGPVMPYPGGNWLVNQIVPPNVDSVIAHPASSQLFLVATSEGSVFQISCHGERRKIYQGSWLSAANGLAVVSSAQGDQTIYYVNSGRLHSRQF